MWVLFFEPLNSISPILKHTFLASQQSQKHVSNILKHSRNLLYSEGPYFYEYPGFSKWRDFTITG
jgi:hypothetical protein